MSVKHRKIGSDTVYPVGLGCMNITHAYGPPIDENDARALFHQALDMGCNFFDTATIYGFGRSEEIVGEVLADRRDDCFLASKCVLGFANGQRTLDARPEAIKAACDASLKRLGTDVIDLYYMHRPDPNVPIEDSMGAMSDLVAAGKIRMVGLSEMGEDHLRRAHSVHPVAAMQTEYSLWVRNPEIAVLEACAELGTTFVSFSPVGRGYLADPPVDPARMHETDMRRGYFPRFGPDYYPANLELLADLKAWAAELDCTVAQLAIAWTLAKGDHVVPIPGTTNPQHLKDNHAAAEIVLGADMGKKLDAHFAPERPAGPRYNAMGQAMVTTEQFDFETGN